MKAGWTSLVLALALGACADSPVSVPVTPDEESLSPQNVADPSLHVQADGSGLVLESLTGVALPLIPIELGDVIIDQAVITNFVVVEDLVGNIIGLQAEGVLQLTGGVLGTDVITEDFVSRVTVTSSGPGQCEIITIDLGGVNIDALGLARAEIPAATLTGSGSGAVGTLLCLLGQALAGLGGNVDNIVDNINRRI